MAIGTLLLRAAAAVLIAVAPTAGAVTSVRVVSGLSSPVDIVNAGDGSNRLFVAEQGGKIRVVAGDRLAQVPFLDITARVTAGGEQGLLGIAFHPRFAEDGRVFVDYTRKADGATVIASYRADTRVGGVADATSEQVLLVIPQPFANHNGGALRFGPDGLLYIGMGDGGSANDPDGHAQDPRSLLGKIVRIDVDRGAPYAIPPGNPYVDGTVGRPEVWALGLRNPWRIGFDRATGDLYIGDVGQGSYEEIDRLPAGQGAGANLGWRMMEGFHCTANGGPIACGAASLMRPILEYSHADGCSVTGGNVHRGSVRELEARYVFADFCSGRIWSAGPDADGAWLMRDVFAYSGSISSFGEDETGETYFVDLGKGELRRLVAEASDRVDAIEFYHAAFDHYFISAEPADLTALDAGVLKGWQRTGRSIAFFGAAEAAAGTVYRFYIPPAQGDSHFFTGDADEAADVRRRFPTFVEEGPLSMRTVLPNRVTGTCPPGMLPVYRIWNNRADSNHRYTIDRALRDLMLARGGIAEGYGPDGVAMCSPV